MTEDLLYFDGVTVSDSRMQGSISSKELIEKFSAAWIPDYQRDRVPNKKKINELKEIFKQKKEIDSIKLNLSGEVHYDRKNGEAVLQGRIDVLDGQQRLWALKESEAPDQRIPVELYLNKTYAEQVELFHQFNGDGTDLTFGDYAKSTVGAFADLVRVFLKRKDLFPFKINVNSTEGGINLSTLCPLIYYCQRKIVRGMVYTSRPAGGRLKMFLAEQHEKNDVALVSYGVRNVMAEFVQIFGEPAPKALAYKRTFFMAWNRVIINEFLQSTGKVEYGRFKTKIHEAPTKLLRSARVIECVAIGGDQGIQFLYDEMISYLNHKLKSGDLPKMHQLKLLEEDNMDFMLEKNRDRNIKHTNIV